MIRTLPERQSAGSIVAALLPAGAHYVKAFGTLAAERSRQRKPRTAARGALLRHRRRHAAATAERLIRAAGFEPVKVGGVSEAGRIERPRRRAPGTDPRPRQARATIADRRSEGMSATETATPAGLRADPAAGARAPRSTSRATTSDGSSGTSTGSPTAPTSRAFLTTSDGVVAARRAADDRPQHPARDRRDRRRQRRQQQGHLPHLLAPSRRPRRRVVAVRQERHADRARGDAEAAAARRRPGEAAERGDLPGPPHPRDRRRAHRARLARPQPLAGQHLHPPARPRHADAGRHRQPGLGCRSTRAT